MEYRDMTDRELIFAALASLIPNAGSRKLWGELHRRAGDPCHHRFKDHSRGGVIYYSACEYCMEKRDVGPLNARPHDLRSSL